MPEERGMADFTLERLAAIVAERARAPVAESYTAQLARDPSRAAKKFGEEAVEAVIAAVENDPKALIAESADVLYHLMALLEARNVPLEAVMAELARRTAQSGLAEKAARGHKA